MKIDNILDMIPQTDFPVGLIGCHAEQANFDCCAYDIVIFDEQNKSDSLINNNDKLIKIRHGSLHENRVEKLIQLEKMQILSDEKWELQMFLAKIKEKKEKLFKTHKKNCIIESQFCLVKANNGLENSDPFIASWIKSAAYFLADAIILLNNNRPSPSHMLSILRNLKSSQTNETLSSVLNSIGLERSTPSLLSRMSKSTIGLSDLIEKNNNSMIIKQKTNYLIEKSLLSDCYFYIGYLNRNIFYSLKDSVNSYPELIHLLKTGFDLENDNITLKSHIESLTNVAETLLNLNEN